MATRTAPAELLTIPETAKRLRCSESHVYRLIASGELPCVDIARKNTRKAKTRVAEDALAAYIKANTRGGQRPLADR